MTYPTEVSTDGGLQLGLAAWKVLSGFNGRPNSLIDGPPIRSTEHRAGTQQSQRVIFRTGIVDCNVPEHVLTNLLSEVDVDAEEVGCTA